jgi:hypothetical protein
MASIAASQVEFEWHVAESGYELLNTYALSAWGCEAEPTREWYLTDGSPSTENGDVRSYYPSLKPALFLSFAETWGMGEDMLAFANQYGTLGASTGRDIALGPLDGNVWVPGRGEPLDQWYGQTTEMQKAAWFWNCVQTHDLHSLSRCISWSQRGDAVSYRYWRERLGEWRGQVSKREPDSEGTIASDYSRSSLLREFAVGDLLQPALTVVRDIISQHLHVYVLPRIEWESSRNWLGMSFAPNGLLGLLWLQFATAVREQKKFQKCAQCRDYFELSEHALKTKKQFCSDACKNRAYRERMEKAMHDSRQILSNAGFSKDSLGAWFSHDARKSFSRNVIRDQSAGWLIRQLADEVPQGEFWFYMNRPPEIPRLCESLLIEYQLSDLRPVVKTAV